MSPWPMRSAIATRVLGGVVVLCVVGLTACSDGAPSAPTTTASPTPAGASAQGEAAGAEPSSSSIPPAAVPEAPATPADPALRLAALMGQHSVLASDMMRARIRGDADLAQAANAALGQNTHDLAEVLDPFVDAAAKQEFEEMWAEHILSLFDYARGHSIHDAAVRDHAREESVEYEGELAEYFVARSQGRLDAATARAAIHDHAQHLLHDADAYAAAEYANAASGYRASYSHTYAFGAQLARALMPATVTGTLDTPAVRLRSELTRLLGEHAALVMAMTRSAAGDPVDFAAMSDALNGNTLDLTAAVDALFGVEPARRFESLWADQVDQLAAYNTAAVRKDTAGQNQARAALESFQSALAGFLAGVTSDRLTATALTQALSGHDARLLAEIDAYASGSFAPAYTISQQIHGATYALAGQLAQGIGPAVAARLPLGGSQTGGGGARTAGAR